MSTEETRECKYCGVVKRMSDFPFSKRKGCRSYYYYRCKKCHNVKHRDSAYNNAKKIKAQNPLRWICNRRLISSRMAAKKNGYLPCLIAVNDLMELYKEDCDVCGTFVGPEIHLDHCHKTGKFRGFLCAKCNHCIGFADDSKEVLAALILYLEKSPNNGSC